MNERIKQLAEQAGITTNLETDYFEKDSSKWVDYYSEKFAELIVEELVNLAKNKSESIVSKAELYDLYATDESELDKARAAVWQLLVFGQEIKKHFGVS